MSHHVGLEGLVQMAFSLFASVGYPAKYACGILGGGALHPPTSLFPCPKVTLGIGLQVPGERFGVLGREVVPWLPG